jgi:hypothetical protein
MHASTSTVRNPLHRNPVSNLDFLVFLHHSKGTETPSFIQYIERLDVGAKELGKGKLYLPFVNYVSKISIKLTYMTHIYLYLFSIVGTVP